MKDYWETTTTMIIVGILIGLKSFLHLSDSDLNFFLFTGLLFNIFKIKNVALKQNLKNKNGKKIYEYSNKKRLIFIVERISVLIISIVFYVLMSFGLKNQLVSNYILVLIVFLMEIIAVRFYQMFSKKYLIHQKYIFYRK